MSEFNLFVYGTLRRGRGADEMMSGCEHLGTATVAGILYDIDGRFPALLNYGDGIVHGEVWRCPADHLPRLDRYEGVADGLFRRIGLEVETPTGALPCWVYAAGPALAHRLSPEHRIAAGEWRQPAHR